MATGGRQRPILSDGGEEGQVHHDKWRCSSRERPNRPGDIYLVQSRHENNGANGTSARPYLAGTSMTWCEPAKMKRTKTRPETSISSDALMAVASMRLAQVSFT